MRLQSLHRTWYKTDIDPESPEYLGAVSDPFPMEGPGRRIVDVDWSVKGEVQVTWLVSKT